MIQPAKLLRTALVTAVLSTVCVVSASAASVGVGTVNTDALRLRDEASTSATVLGTASKGDTVVVLEDAGNGWYKVDYKSVEGYMSGEYLNVSAKADVTIGYGLVQSQGSPLNVRSGPGTSYGKVTSLNNGAVVNIVGIDNGWYKISTNGVTGYVSSQYIYTGDKAREVAAENVIERAVILTTDGLIRPDLLPPAMQAPCALCSLRGTLPDALEQLERQLITEALQEHRGNMGHAAQALGISERVMGLRMRKFGLGYKAFRRGAP